MYVLLSKQSIYKLCRPTLKIQAENAFNSVLIRSLRLGDVIAPDLWFPSYMFGLSTGSLQPT